MHFHSVDYDFIETLGVKMLKGRSFTRDFNDDSCTVFLLNRSAVEKMGLEQPVGRTMTLGQDRGRIVGVFEDFNYNTIHHKINPQTLVLDRAGTRGIFFRIVPGRSEQALAHAEKVWKDMEPDHPFSFEFMDQQLDHMYRAEQRIGTLFRYFTFFAILISCLGLLGLASFMTEQRQKEIGIRKVMGSRVSQLIFLLTRDFTRWVIIAGMVGLPLGYYAMNKWLQNFHYRTELSPVTFAGALLLALLIAVLTVSIQTYRASVKNPVDTLRDE
jgi:putative ABC transport system permease protein